MPNCGGLFSLSLAVVCACAAFSCAPADTFSMENCSNHHCVLLYTTPARKRLMMCVRATVLSNVCVCVCVLRNCAATFRRSMRGSAASVRVLFCFGWCKGEMYFGAHTGKPVVGNASGGTEGRTRPYAIETRLCVRVGACVIYTRYVCVRTFE